MIPDDVRAWLDRQGYGVIQAVQPVAGGCINNGARLLTSTGGSFFLKTNPAAPMDMFERESEGLSALQGAGEAASAEWPRVPLPYAHGDNFLLLEDLRPAPRRNGFWAEFGRRLANLHHKSSPQFGFPHNNYIGSTPQLNQWTADGHQFFAMQRLHFQADLAQRNGLFNARDLHQVELLCQRLTELIPPQPASLLHGDLWIGNVISDSQGAPAMIDPAVHFGWAEAELAMTSLFGAFPDDFYSAYQETFPLEKGFRQRFPIYNLYHLLNHLNLFGSGYLSQVRSILHRFT